VAQPKADGAEPKVGFYGSASYRLRGRILSASAKEPTEDMLGNIIWKPAQRMDQYGGGIVSDSLPAEMKSRSVSAFDYQNLFGWLAGMKIKVDDALSLQFQIGNDWNAGEQVSWRDNNSVDSRVNFVNCYVHLAYANWNPGPVYLVGGVIPVSSNGTLDLLERSLSNGSYSEAIFKTWQTNFNNSLIGLKLGVPIVESDEFNLAAELTTSVIDPRTHYMGTWGFGYSGAFGDDYNIIDTVRGSPTSVMFILDVPVAAGEFKVTPEFTTVINRNYNSVDETGDHEFLFGLSAGYKVSDDISVSLSGAYGTVSNKNTLAGEYGSSQRLSNDPISPDYGPWGGRVVNKNRNSLTLPAMYVWEADLGGEIQSQYASSGFLVGIGGTVKAGPGTFALDFKLGTSSNSIDKWNFVGYEINPSTGAATQFNPLTGAPIYVKKELEIPEEYKPLIKNAKTDILLDLRYTWNVHPKFSITPRWRFFYSGYDDDRNTAANSYWSGYPFGYPTVTSISSKMENRPEIILTGSF